MFLPVTFYKKPLKNNKSVLSDAIKLGITTGIIATGVQALSHHVNQKTTTLSTTDYLMGMALMGAVGGTLNAGFNFFAPMWREITEYRPDKSPFNRETSFSDLSYIDLNPDLYS